MSKNIDIQEFANILIQLRELNYPIDFIERYCDYYNFEENDEISFSESFIRDYNFIMSYFQENILTLNQNKFKKIIDFLIKSIENNIHRDEIMIFLYSDDLNILQQKLKNNIVDENTFNQELEKLIGNEFELKNILKLINN